MGRPRVFQESRNLVIRVEMRLHERLTKLAEERDVAVSELVRPLLEELVAGKRKRVAKGERK
jgi:predicted HicB family RNase H-like nuclease